MTRDEAVEVLYKIHYPDDFRFGGAVLAAKHAENKKSVERHISGLVALSILKLDEPVSVEDRFHNSLIASGVSIQKVQDALKDAGLKIVEK